MSGYLIRHAASSYAAGTKGWEEGGGREGKPEKFDWCDLRWKNLSQEIWILQFDCPPSFCSLKYELAKDEKGSSFPVFGELCWTVHKHGCFFLGSFDSFFQEDFFGRPFVMARQDGGWWLVTL